MGNFYSIYKPLRNYLRDFNRLSVIYSCYQFIQYLDSDRPLPIHFRNPLLLTKLDWLRRGIVQWEFEILIREAILNCPLRGGKQITHWNEISKAINHIKRIENSAFGLHPRREDDVFFELVRIAHRQFPWQTGLNQDYIARYHWLYRQPGLHEAIEQIFDLSPTELFQISLGLAGHFLSNIVLDLPVKNEINKIEDSKIESLIDHFSVSMAEAEQKFEETRELNVNWAYSFNVFREKPLLRISPTKILCPIPDFLVRRVASGLYFDLVRQENVGSKHLGPAVQGLIGEIANSQAGDTFEVTPEAEYGSRKRPKNSIDWIVSDSTGHLFIEAKAARVRFRGMSDLIDREQIRKEFDRIRLFALQSYLTINDALTGKYRHWRPDSRPVFLGIVTLEDWQSVGIHIEREVIGPLRDELQDHGINPEIQDRIPMAFFSVADLEAVFHVARTHTLAEVFARKSEGEYAQWQLGVFLGNKFGDDLRDFVPNSFADEWRLIGI